MFNYLVYKKTNKRLKFRQISYMSTKEYTYV